MSSLVTVGSRGRRGASLLWRALVWLVLLIALAVLSVSVLVPRLAGATPYTVLTGSMRPDLAPGSLVVTRPVDMDDLRVGDVVTVQLDSGRADYVTHRVVAVQYGLDGEARIQTQGDANATPDTELRRPEQVRGRLWYAVPQLGRLSQLLSPGQRRDIASLAGGVLVLYASYLFGSALWERSRHGERPARHRAVSGSS